MEPARAPVADEGARYQNPKIRFLFYSGGVEERLWYHVPRVGDQVVVGEHNATVKQVFWGDDEIKVYCE